jgi:hypothetical protein
MVTSWKEQGALAGSMKATIRLTGLAPIRPGCARSSSSDFHSKRLSRFSGSMRAMSLPPADDGSFGPMEEIVTAIIERGRARKT